MPDDAHLLLVTFTALLPITNPLGNAGIFLSLTEGQTHAQRHRLALRGAIYMFAILATFLLAGNFILHFFGLSLDGIRLAGGLLILKYGFNQLSPSPEHTHSAEEHAEAKAKEDISFSPLAMPLLAGPGAIASVMSTSSLIGPASPMSYAFVLGGIFLTCLVSWITLREAEGLLKILGVNGANALTKIMGFLLICIGVQIMITGAQGLLNPAS
jgi:multiple antibiotic resistance protein